MKKFIVYLIVIIMVISLGFAIFYLVRDNEVISISQASIYTDVNKTFNIDVNHLHKKSYTKITITSSNSSVVSYNKDKNNFKAVSGGVARINFRTTNAKFRNLWCDVIVGDGTVESPFYISTMEQLASIGMGERVEDSSDDNPVYWGKGEYRDYRSDMCYKLVADVNLNDYNNGLWAPLRHFTGRFDGNGMTITNMYINKDSYLEMTNVDHTPFDESGSNLGVGLFKSIGANAVVYNLKFDNVIIKGSYNTLGIVAGRNSGTIERIEVKSAMISAKSTVFGGIVGLNQSTQVYSPIIEPVLDSQNNPVLDTDGNPTTTTTENYARVIARVDRCSINNLVIGIETTVDENTHQETTQLIGIGGHVGGVVGKNFGGTVVYCYATGEVYFGNLSTVYGGVIAENQVISLTNPELLTDNIDKQGANIKDCYSNLKTYLTNATPTTSSCFGGVIGKNTDSTNGQYYDAANIKIVNNYIIGNYYNRDNLNYEQQGITKNFRGIASFKMDTTNVDFADKEYIVMGLDTDEMKVQQNFISHATQNIEFNENGDSKGVVDSEVTWLFGTVWSINEGINDGMPYLNYQLIYIPDDFATVGTPVVEDTTDYKFIVEVEYPVSILSGVDKKLTIKVGETYQLAISPENLKVTWSSNDTSIVTVDANGKITGIKKGVAQVQVKTRFGSMDYITINVEDVVFTINGVPKSITLEVGGTYELTGITVTPTPKSPYALTYTSKSSSIASISGTTVTGVAVGDTTIDVKCGNTKKTITVHVVAAEDKVVYITTNPTKIEGVYGDGHTISGNVTVTGKLKDNTNANVQYSFESSDPSVLTITSAGAYRVVGAGTGIITVTVTTTGYEGTKTIPFIITQYVPPVTYDATISTTAYSMTQGDTFTLTVSGDISTLSWKRSNTNVSISSTYSASITVTGQKVGTTVLTATVKFPNGETKALTCTVTVTAPKEEPVVIPNTASLSTTSITVDENASASISVSGTNIKNVNWSTSNSKIELQRTGVQTTLSNKVTGKSAGTAEVFAEVTFNDGKKLTRTCNVTVNAIQIISYTAYISQTSKNMYVGDSFILSVTGDVKSAGWSTSSASVASVNPTTGIQTVVSGVSAGSATITAKVTKPDNSVVNLYCTVVVQEVAYTPVTATLDTYSTTITEGNSVTITATTSNGTTNVTWSYSDTTADTFAVSGNRITLSTTVIHSSRTHTVTARTADSTVTATITVNGTEAHISSVSSVNDLLHLSSCTICQAKSLYLTANINMGGIAFTPIGSSSTNAFTGSLTGKSMKYTISNFTVSNTTYAGLFGYTKGATIENVIVSNATISGTYAGGIVGYAYDTKISSCETKNSNITGGDSAGGIVGYLAGNSAVTSSVSTSNNVTGGSGSGFRNVGGIIGQMTAGKASSCKTENGTMSLISGAYGYVGGIAGYSAGSIENATVRTTVRANNSDNDYAGGIVGYTRGIIDKATVNNGTKVTGAYAGGLGGAMNTGISFTINFSTSGKSYRYSDISSSNYMINVQCGAVKNGVTIKGNVVGGLFGQINSGVVSNSYARARLEGTSSSAVKGGFAAYIMSSGLGAKGGTGQFGVVQFSYSACTFDSTGSNQAVTKSSIHTEQTNRNAGFVFNYVFDKDLAGSAYYDGTSGDKVALIPWTGKDNINANKSTSDMKNSSTYINLGFGGAWRFNGDYPTLSTEIVF